MSHRLSRTDTKQDILVTLEYVGLDVYEGTGIVHTNAIPNKYNKESVL